MAVLKKTMTPHADNVTELNKNVPKFEKLVAPSADSHKFRLHPVEGPVMMIYLFIGFYATYVSLTSAKLPTLLFTFFMVIPSMLGLGAGVHRLWSHRSYKVKPPLEIMLTIFYVLCDQRSIITWARRHRLHHQCSDTDGDPHNAQRGFWFSHYGWMVMEQHPEVEKRLKHIDVSDLYNNPIIKFQHDYFVPMTIIISYVIPTYIPTLWGESVYVSFMSNTFRKHICLHLICSINSVAHLVGYKPIDRTVVGTQTQFLATLTVGEGFHNYHHTFPYDYRSSELGDYKYNLSAMFIDVMAKIGWAYDLKVTSEEVIKNRVLVKGDGTDIYYVPNNQKKQNFFTTQLFQKTIETIDH